MIQLGSQDRDRHAEEISWLEHELAEASCHLKQSLAANFEFSERLAREVAEKEKAQQGVVEAEPRLLEMVAEVARVMVEERYEKLLSMATELAHLQAARDEVEADLDRNYD